MADCKTCGSELVINESLKRPIRNICFKCKYDELTDRYSSMHGRIVTRIISFEKDKSSFLDNSLISGVYGR